MGKKIESSAQWKLDVSDLKKGLQQSRYELSKLTSEFKQSTAGMDNWTSNADGLKAKLNQLEGSLKVQQSDLANLEKQYELTAKACGETSPKALKLEADIAKQRATVAQTEADLKKYADALGDLADKEEKAGGKLQELTNKLGGAFKGAVFGAGAKIGSFLVEQIGEFISSAWEMSQEIDNLSSKLGYSAEQMGQVQENLGKAFSMGGSSDAIMEAVVSAEQLGKMMGMSADEVGTLTGGIALMSDKLGMDTAESINSVRTLMQNFGLTSQQAMDYMTTGAQQGLNMTQDLADSVTEYGKNIAEAGYSAQEMFAIAEVGLQSGARNTDVVYDSMNELITRIEDGSFSTENFGETFQEAFKKAQEEGVPLREQLRMVGEEIARMPEGAEKSQVLADTFGTLAETAGDALVPVLTGTADGFEAVNGATEGMASNMDKLKGVFSEAMSIFAADMATAGNAVAGFILSVGENLPTMLSTMKENIVTWAEGVKTKFEEMKANVTAKVEELKVNAVNKWLEMTNAASDWIANMCSRIASGAVNMVTGYINTWISGVNTFRSLLTSVISAVASWVSQLVSRAASGARNMVNSFMNIIRSLPSQVVSVGRNICSGLVRGISSGIGSIISAARNMAARALAAAKSALGVKSPSREFMKVGRYVDEGFERGVLQGLPHMARTVSNTFKSVIPNGEDYTSNSRTVTRGGTTYVQNVYTQKPIDAAEVYRQSASLIFTGG